MANSLLKNQNLQGIYEKGFDPKNVKQDELIKHGRDLCGYVYWAHQSNISLKTDANPKALEYCTLVADSKFYSTIYAHEDLTLIVAQQFVK